MEIVIRPAKPEEIDILLMFEKEIIEIERPFDSTLKESEIHYYDLLEFIKSPNAEILIAVINDEIVGSGYAKILTAKPYQKYSEYAYLGFMFVKPAFRGKGVNKKIIDELIQWAKTKEITEIRLEVYNANEAAKKAYLKVGFKPNLLEMRIEI